MELDLSNLGTPEVILVAIIGAVVLFLGYRVKKVAFFLIWFALGFYLVSTLLPYLTNVLPPAVFEWPLYRTLLPLAGGLLLALLGFSIEKLCVAGICFALVMLITVQYFGTSVQALAIGAVVGVVLAGVSTAFIRPAVIIATSVAGAYMLTMALLVLVPSLDPQIAYFPVLLGLSALGLMVQFSTTKGLQ